VNDGAAVDIPPPGMNSLADEFMFIDGWKLDAVIFKPPSPMAGVLWGVNTVDVRSLSDISV
jgi:hypothetical protein